MTAEPTTQPGSRSEPQPPAQPCAGITYREIENMFPPDLLPPDKQAKRDMAEIMRKHRLSLRAALVCSRRRERGDAACSNGRGIRTAEVEARVLAAVRDEMLHPDLIEKAVRKHHARANDRAKADRASRFALDRDLAEVKRRAERLVDQVEQGVLSGASIRERLEALEARRATLEAELAEAPVPEVLTLHPASAARYRQLVENLTGALEAVDTVERLRAREALRALVRRVVVTPLEERGRFGIAIEGNIAALVRDQDGDIIAVGAGTRSGRYDIEPVRLKA